MKEYWYDKLLNIYTRGKSEEVLFGDDHYYYPYEPTSYYALETLMNHYEINSDDQFVDFGCGKGRLPLYLYHYYGVTAAGIEMDSVLYDAALRNKQSYSEKHGVAEEVEFYLGYAEEYKPSGADNRFYFFNPFSLSVFHKVIQNITAFYQKENRDVELILYYPSDEYITYLSKKTDFVQKKEIRIPFLYRLDHSERFLIYKNNGI